MSASVTSAPISRRSATCWSRTASRWSTPSAAPAVPALPTASPPKYIFPGGYIPGLSELIAANDGLNWYVSDIETLRLHYAYTIRAWYDRTVAAKDAIVALYDERFYRMWTF